MRTDPRLVQNWNNFTEGLDSANQSAQANLWAFSQNILGPCLASLGECSQACAAQCFPHGRDDRLRRSRGRSRGRRAEYGFDFYDEWDDLDDDAGAGDALLGIGNDEMDRLLAGSGSYSGNTTQPGRARAMSYGTRKNQNDGRGLPKGRRKTAVLPHDGRADPTVIPTTSAFGFLGRIPWTSRIVGKGLKYKPSAADLQDRSGTTSGVRSEHSETEPLLEEEYSDENEPDTGYGKGKSPAAPAPPNGGGRPRSNTADTDDSFSSRGDLFPSDDDADDAVPLDDEFAMVLDRRNTDATNSSTGVKSNRTRTSSRRKRSPSARSRASATSSTTNNPLPPSTTTTIPQRSASSSALPITLPLRTSSPLARTLSAEHVPAPPLALVPPSLTDLQAEEARLGAEEEDAVRGKRERARVLALEKGLGDPARRVGGDEPPLSPPPDVTSRSEPPSESESGSEGESPSPAPRPREAEEGDGFVPARLPAFAGGS